MFSQIVLNIILSSLVYLVISISFLIIYYPCKFFNISHAAIISLGAYFTFFLLKQCSLSLWLAFPIAVILSILLALILELIVYRPLRQKKTSSLILLIASIGIYIIVQNCISLIWGDDTKSISSTDVKVGNEFLGAYITNIQLTIIIVSILLIVLSLLFLKFNIIGQNIRAISSNALLANITGINNNKIILWSFGIGSGMAAIAGILVASDTGLSPMMGFNLLLYGIVAMIIGGVGSNWGLIGGAFLIAASQHLTAYFIDSKWIDAITYIILILFLIWKPLGFSGKRMKKIEI